MTKQDECECSHCKGNFDFHLDDFLLSEVQKQNVIIFAGAGTSTENGISSPHSLYVELALAAGVGKSGLAFPDLAQIVADQPDGRFKLLQLIQTHFDYVSRFRSLLRNATRFHCELATMPYLNTFVTTNWDRFFEEHCDAKPFVYNSDMRFWDIPRRKVLKVHGSIDDYSSIVATRADYDECLIQLRSSLIGAKLKELLASKTCIFIGYSLKDDDINEIFSFVAGELGKFKKTHYFVSPEDPDLELPDQCLQIKTDGTFFLKTLKEHMCSSSCLAADSSYELAEAELVSVCEEHEWLHENFRQTEHPQSVLSSVYQDGLMDGYSRIIDGRASGRFSDLHALQRYISSYEATIDSYRRERQYIDVAYFRGYQNAAIGFLMVSRSSDDVWFPPKFYFEKVGELDREHFKEIFEDLPSVHKAAFVHCKKAIKNLKPGMAITHMPWG